MLMGGVAASRFGLWMFDLAVIQQMQKMENATEAVTVVDLFNRMKNVKYRD
uniref:Solute carrier family 40 member n=1 Tax=Brassica campestris TaxID=3711 RepID=A0A3P5Z792_BRACM|nr:unnamed protein product [Brassica rapa]